MALPPKSQVAKAAVLPSLTVTVSGPTGSSERSLGVGTHVFGGSLASDVVIVGLAAPELFSITRQNNQAAFDLRIMTEGVTVDDKPLVKGETIIGIKSARIAHEAFLFTMGDINPSEPTTFAEQLAHNARKMRSSLGVAGSNPKLQLASGSISQKFNQAWTTNPQAIGALGVAVLLAGLALVAPRNLSSNGANFSSSVAATVPMIDTTSNLATEIRAKLRSADLSHVVSLEEGNNQVTLSGSVNQAENLRLRDVLGGFQGRIKTPLTLRNAVAYARPDGDHLVAGILLSPQKAVVTDTGQLVAVDETLPSGWRVVSISDSRVEITKDGLAQLINLPANPVSTSVRSAPPAGRR
jgi:hypothetical protein